MNEIQATIHKLGTVVDALTGKEGDGLVVSFGEFKQTALSWKSFKQLIGLRCPKVEVKGPSISTGHTVSHSTDSSGPGSVNGTSVGHSTTTTTPK